jgi:hypothetical protein
MAMEGKWRRRGWGGREGKERWHFEGLVPLN